MQRMLAATFGICLLTTVQAVAKETDDQRKARWLLSEASELLTRGDVPEAVATLERLLAEYPDEELYASGALAKLAGIRAERGEDYETPLEQLRERYPESGAARWAQRLVELGLAPGEPGHQLLLGYGPCIRRFSPEAHQALREASEQERDGDSGEAARLYGEVAQQFAHDGPTARYALARMARALRKAGRLEEDLAVCRRLVEEYPQSDEAVAAAAALVSSASARGDHEEAVRLCRQALRLMEDLPTQRSLLVASWVGLARHHANAGQPALARAALEHCAREWGEPEPGLSPYDHVGQLLTRIAVQEQAAEDGALVLEQFLDAWQAGWQVLLYDLLAPSRQVHIRRKALLEALEAVEQERGRLLGFSLGERAIVARELDEYAAVLHFAGGKQDPAQLEATFRVARRRLPAYIEGAQGPLCWRIIALPPELFPKPGM